jgi:hypothetical protein
MARHFEVVKNVHQFQSMARTERREKTVRAKFQKKSRIGV